MDKTTSTASQIAQGRALSAVKDNVEFDGITSAHQRSQKCLERIEEALSRLCGGLKDAGAPTPDIAQPAGRVAEEAAFAEGIANRLHSIAETLDSVA